MIATGVTAAIAALALTPVVRTLARRFGAIDVPNQRSSHSVSTPRGGGVAILAGAAAAVAIRGTEVISSHAFLVAGLALIALTGLVDDFARIRASWKFAAQVAAAGLVVVGDGEVLRTVDSPWGDTTIPLTIGLGLTVLWLVGVANAYNFMDGINGIAACTAIVCGLAQGWLALRSGNELVAMIAIALGMAAAGFLPFNLPRGTIFMGDVGSGALGLGFASIAVILANRGGSFIAAALPLAPFLFDTSVTLASRLVRGEHLATAHRDHLYQKLVETGWTHATVTAVWTSLAVSSSLVGVAWSRLGGVGRGIGLFILLGAHIGVVILVVFRLARVERHRP